MDYQNLCKSAHAIWASKIDAKGDEKLKESLDFLGWEISPAETRSFARLVGALAICLGIMFVFLLSFLMGFSPPWILFVVFSFVLYFYISKYPTLKAGEEKQNAAPQMPGVVSYLLMSLRINPNIERGVEFAAGHATGLFKMKLEGILWAVKTGRGSVEAGLEKLANDFSDWSEFGRSIKLIISSNSEGSEENRQKTLDKASDVLLEGLAARTEKQARDLNTPVMVLFTFGVILPLIFVAIVPFISLMGMQIGPFAIAIIYTVALPLLIYLAIRFIVSNRPMTILPPKIPDKGRPMVYILISVGAGLAFLLPILGGNKIAEPLEFMPILWAVGCGTGIFFLLTTWRLKVKRAEIKKAEDSFGESLHELSALLAEGHPLESAMNKSRSDFFRVAANNIKILNKGLKSSFFDVEIGSLNDVYSETIKGAIDILTSIADKGSENMAKVGFKLSEHTANMKKCEESIHRSLGGVVSSMRIIAMVVAPLVGGMISSMSVVLAETVSKSQGANMSMGGGSGALDPNLISLIIGIYAFESAIMLVMFGSDLLYGNDRVMKGYNIGIASLAAVFIFTVCILLSNGLFSGIA